MAQAEDVKNALLLRCGSCQVPQYHPRQLLRHVVLSGHQSRCPVCDRYKPVQELVRHIKHHCNPAYNCLDCGAWITVRGLSQHILQDHANGFGCPLGCPERFASAEDYVTRRGMHRCRCDASQRWSRKQMVSS